MANEIELVESVMRSDLPRQQKTAFQRIIDRVTGGKLSRQIENQEIVVTGDHQRALGKVVRDGAEGMAIGAAYGYLDATTGLDPLGVPVDLSAGAAAGITSTLLGSHPLAEEARNIASSSFTVFGFRKMKAITEKKRALAGAAAIAHGEAEDPIIAVAKGLK